MSFFVQDSGFVIANLLYQAAVLIAVARWISSWILRYRSRSSSLSPSSSSSSPSCSCSISTQTIKDSLAVTTFGSVRERSSRMSDTCAVCLCRMDGCDEVREMQNCCHVFHRECIDRWIDHDDHDDCDYHGHDHDDGNRKACPLCRAPLFSGFRSVELPKNEPSWAVERLLYLFGDDLLAC